MAWARVLVALTRITGEYCLVDSLLEVSDPAVCAWRLAQPCCAYMAQDVMIPVDGWVNQRLGQDNLPLVVVVVMATDQVSSIELLDFILVML